MINKIKWERHTKTHGNIYSLEGRANIKYNGQYFRFYIIPSKHNGRDVYTLETGCGFTKRIATSYNIKDLKEIANNMNNGIIELSFLN
jgi:hypothetical protein